MFPTHGTYCSTISSLCKNRCVMQAFEPLFTATVTATQNDGAFVNNEFADICLVRVPLPATPGNTLYVEHTVVPDD